MEPNEVLGSTEPGPLADWSEADKLWHAKLPFQLQPVAARYGRKLFAVAMQAGTITEGLSMLASAAGRNQQLVLILQNMAQAADQMCRLTLTGMGKGTEDLKEIQGEIERIQAITQASRQPGDKVTRSGIILDS